MSEASIANLKQSNSKLRDKLKQLRFESEDEIDFVDDKILRPILGNELDKYHARRNEQRKKEINLLKKDLNEIDNTKYSIPARNNRTPSPIKEEFPSAKKLPVKSTLRSPPNPSTTALEEEIKKLKHINTTLEDKLKRNVTERKDIISEFTEKENKMYKDHEDEIRRMNKNYELKLQRLLKEKKVLEDKLKHESSEVDRLKVERQHNLTDLEEQNNRLQRENSKLKEDNKVLSQRKTGDTDNLELQKVQDFNKQLLVENEKLLQRIEELEKATTNYTYGNVIDDSDDDDDDDDDDDTDNTHTNKFKIYSNQPDSKSELSTKKIMEMQFSRAPTVAIPKTPVTPPPRKSRKDGQEDTVDYMRYTKGD
ncbi:hypothetical protein G210_1127 [Candida maltosa Xu316]|uniref:Uncharacterized protein n=1 Tax=Candida maltosa (strain Xu316) TaxID=1245528 RepID=M3K0U4_CANMX|nr:hypothetical protein G210_1127 [Candida maltosa Xu316]